MKSIEGLTTEDKEVFKAPLEQATPHSANTIADLRKIDKICNVIDASGDILELEDAEFAFLRERFDNYANWGTSKEARCQILSAVEKLDKVGKR